MAPRTNCPKCGEVRIDKGTLRKSTSGTEIIWLANCPICGQTLNSENVKSYPVQEEDILTAPDDDFAEIKYKAKEKLAKTSKPDA
jgi:transcription elongation factor Elf1